MQFDRYWCSHMTDCNKICDPLTFTLSRQGKKEVAYKFSSNCAAVFSDARASSHVFIQMCLTKMML